MNLVTKEMIDNMCKHHAIALIQNHELPFEDMETMCAVADIAELDLLCFWDCHKRRPSHRYELLDYQESQLMGGMPRIKEKEKDMKTN